MKPNTLLKNALFNLAIAATAIAVLTAVPVPAEALFSLIAISGLGCIALRDYRIRRPLTLRLAARPAPAVTRPAARRVSALVAA